MADNATTPNESTDVTPEATVQDDNNQTPDTSATEVSTSQSQDDSTPESDHAETTSDSSGDDSDEKDVPDKDSEGAPEDGEDDSDDSDDSDDDGDTDDSRDDMEAKHQRSLRKARREAANLRSRLKESEAQANRYKVAMESGIPSDAMEFITGDSLEAMEQSAEKLLVMMGYHGRVTPPGGPVETGGNPRRGDFTKVDQARQTENLDTIGSRIYDNQS